MIPYLESTDGGLFASAAVRLLLPNSTWYPLRSFANTTPPFQLHSSRQCGTAPVLAVVENLPVSRRLYDQRPACRRIQATSSEHTCSAVLLPLGRIELRGQLPGVLAVRRTTSDRSTRATIAARNTTSARSRTARPLIPRSFFGEQVAACGTTAGSLWAYPGIGNYSGTQYTSAVPGAHAPVGVDDSIVNTAESTNSNLWAPVFANNNAAYGFTAGALKGSIFEYNAQGAEPEPLTEPFAIGQYWGRITARRRTFSRPSMRQESRLQSFHSGTVVVTMADGRVRLVSGIGCPRRRGTPRSCRPTATRLGLTGEASPCERAEVPRWFRHVHAVRHSGSLKCC